MLLTDIWGDAVLVASMSWCIAEKLVDSTSGEVGHCCRTWLASIGMLSLVDARALQFRCNGLMWKLSFVEGSGSCGVNPNGGGAGANVSYPMIYMPKYLVIS